MVKDVPQMPNLPIKYPMVNSSMNSSHLLSVVEVCSSKMDWLHNHYIHLYLGANMDVMDLEFLSPEQSLGHFPYLNFKEIRLGPECVAVKQILDCLAEKEYVEVSLDEFYIEGKHYFNKVHFERNFMIYGYDDLSHTFSIAGSDYDKIFEFHELPADQIISSLRAHAFERHSIRSVRLNEADKMHFEPTTLIASLGDYYYSRQPKTMVTCPETDGGSCWGMKVYGALLDYLDRLARNEIFYCVRPFHLLWEHKKCMVNRLGYLSQCGYNLSDFIMKGYEDIYETTLILRNILVKYHLEPDLNLLRIAARTVESIDEQERALLSALLKEFSTVISKIEEKENSR
ncbi:hypothetical protein [Paenibacillus sp. FSL H7-0918]|uniref:hypothetical protein n=1 Tax=Paenibacillus sp. FSL H7-0918 TaxID=2921442 RepID=UPI0030F984CD